MAAGDIDTFMGAIRAIESGEGNPRGKYTARGPVIRSGQYAGERALGAYQIMPGNWDAWAREAGVPGANWRDPKMQDIIARHKMLSLYRKYGRWDYVAGEWFAGAGGLRRFLNEQGDPTDGISHLSGYMDRVRRLMSEQGAEPGSVQARFGNAGSGDQSGARPTTSSPSPSSPNPYSRFLATSPYTPYSPANPNDLGRTALPDDGQSQQPSTSTSTSTRPPSADLFEGMLASISNRLRHQGEQQVQAGEPGPGTDDPSLLPDTTTLAPDGELTLADTPSTLLEGAGTDPFTRNSSIGGAMADVAIILQGTGLSESLDGNDDEGLAALPPTMSDLDRSRMMEAVTAGTYSPTDNPSAILAIGEQFIGIPYKWGGNNPQEGFDCSGLVKYVFEQVGVSLPRYSGDQAKAGTAVASLDEARPGDLVFWYGSGGRPNHIGIYAGDGKFLEAPRTGLDVRYREITKTPHKIRRVI